VARLGGDEFAVVLPDIGSTAEAREVAERLLAVLQCPADLDGTAVDVSGSIGVAVYPLDSRNSTELLQHADIAMYAAKRGHLGVAVYDMETAQRDLRQLSVLGELRRALDEHELVLHYQPKVYTGSGYTCGVEALVRWQHPQRGLLGPGEFIPLAEDSELIHPLTDYVLEAALDQHDRWRDEGVVLPLAVNVATQCLLADTFADRVAAALARHRAEPGHLTLEITESALIADPDRAAAVLATLRQLGVRLSIDDFGTGYAAASSPRCSPRTATRRSCGRSWNWPTRSVWRSSPRAWRTAAPRPRSATWAATWPRGTTCPGRSPDRRSPPGWPRTRCTSRPGCPDAPPPFSSRHRPSACASRPRGCSR